MAGRQPRTSSASTSSLTEGRRAAHMLLTVQEIRLADLVRHPGPFRGRRFRTLIEDDLVNDGHEIGWRTAICTQTHRHGPAAGKGRRMKSIRLIEKLSGQAPQLMSRHGGKCRARPRLHEEIRLQLPAHSQFLATFHAFTQRVGEPVERHRLFRSNGDWMHPAGNMAEVDLVDARANAGMDDCRQ